MGQPSRFDEPVEPRTAAGDGGAHHRSTHRKRTLKAAKVVLTDWTTIDCTIRDISKDGVRLVFGDAFTLPQEFRVLIVMTNTIAPVRLLWQRGQTAGVAFTGPEEPAHARHHKPGETQG
jgi:hypothetical protein